MQSQSSAPLYDLWGLVPNGDQKTIAFREPELSELIAASSESNPAVTGAVTEYASETAIDIAIEAHELAHDHRRRGSLA